MPRVGSLEGEFWGGYCPDCLSVESDMCLNLDDCWECPICNLQISTKEVVTVLPILGIGHFMKSRGSLVTVSDFAPTQVGVIANDLPV